MSTILVTGAGTGFGKESALRLAARNHKVIAGVEIFSQIYELQQIAKKRGVLLQVEKLDIADSKDREKAWQWEIDILVNNAGIAEGGSVVDIPEKNLRLQFEINVFGTILLTQGFAKKMIKKKAGKIIFMSSVAGLITDALSGPYCASKHAMEAFSSALNKELQEFGVQVATINPGPYLTGFNDRMYETWKDWVDDPQQRTFDYEKLSFPHVQLDPDPVFDMVVAVVTGKSKSYRNLVPKALKKIIQLEQKAKWDLRQNPLIGIRNPTVQSAYEMSPATTPKKFLLSRLFGKK